MLVIKGLVNTYDIDDLTSLFDGNVTIWDVYEDNSCTVHVNSKAVVEYGDDIVEIFNDHDRSEWVTLRMPEDCTYIGRE